MQAKTWVGINVNRELENYSTEDTEVSWEIVLCITGYHVISKMFTAKHNRQQKVELLLKGKRWPSKNSDLDIFSTMPDAWKSSLENVLVILRTLLLDPVHSSHLCCRSSCLYLIIFLFQITTFWLTPYKVESVGKSVWIEFEVHSKTWPSVFFSFPSNPAACWQVIPSPSSILNSEDTRAPGEFSGSPQLVILEK